jgi:hypothetical protein
LRRGGWRAWGPARGQFERCLGEQEGAAVIAARVESEVRPGREYVPVVVAATVDAADLAEALDLACRTFLKATGDDAEGWDMASDLRSGIA